MIPRQSHRTSGLTAVELLIAIAVIALIIAATLLYVRRVQHQQLQAGANANPAQVFDIALRSEPDRIVQGEPFRFILEIHNPTPFPLQFSWHSWWLGFMLHPEAASAKKKPYFSGKGQRTKNASFLRDDGAWELTYQFSETPSTLQIEPDDRLVFRLHPTRELLEYVAADTDPVPYEVQVFRFSRAHSARDAFRAPVAVARFVNHPRPATEPAEASAP